MVSPKSAPSRTDTNLYSAIIGEGLAHMRYQAFAIRAMEEGYPEVAQIFLEVAGAETAHALQHLRVSGEVKSTAENLKAVTEGEAYEFETMYPNMIKDAEAEGRPEAVASFRMAMEREKYHLVLFTQALEEHAAKLRGQVVAPTAVMPSAATPTAVTPRPLEATAKREEVEQERWRVAALTRIREMVFGAQDGLLSMVALVTSMRAAFDDSRTVIVAGFAGALSGALSMATGAFLGSRAEREVELAEVAKEARELKDNPAEELAELIALYQREGMSAEEARRVAERIASDRELWLKTMVEKELGLSAEPTGSPPKDALVMGGSYIVAALLPVLPYLFIRDKLTVIGVSVALTLIGLFGLGMLKAKLTGRSLWRSGLEILGIGIASAGVGYVLGDLIPRLVGR